MNAQREQFSRFTRNVLVVLGLVALAFVLWQIRSALLLLFAGIILAVLLSSLTEKLHTYSGLPRRGAQATVILLILALVGLATWVFGSQIARQADQLSQQLQQSIDQLRQYGWAQTVIERISQLAQSQEGAAGAGIFSRVTGLASSVIDIIASLLIIVFLGIYLAAVPGLYKEGVALLFPEKQRARVREALDVTGEALWLWLLAQFVSMTVVGLLAWLGLMLLGVQLAPLLGVAAGLLEFIPLVGPLLAVIPATLVAFLQGPTQALYTILLFIGIQQIESYVVMPVVMQHGARLPPALTLMAAVIFGLLFGPLGVIVATPLMLTVLVLTEMLYVEDVLGTSIRVPGRNRG